MGVVRTIVGRNLRLFFRDRLNVFFSLLSAIILFALYTLFLGNLQTTGLQESFPEATTAEIKAFVDSWMFAGIVGMTSITTGLGALGVLVEDAASSRFRDFLVSPIRRGQIVAGYLLAALIVALLMTLIVLVISLLYLWLVDGVVLPPLSVLRIVGWIALSGAAFTALSAFAVSFLSSNSAFSAMSTIVGTILGFIAGAYIPVGSLPDAVREVINALPFGQSAMVLRREFTHGTLDTLTGGVPEASDSIATFYGIDLTVGDWAVTAPYVAAILGGMIVVFFALASARIRARIV